MIDVRVSKKDGTDSLYRWTVDYHGVSSNFYDCRGVKDFLHSKRIEMIAACDTAISCANNMNNIIQDLTEGQ